MKTLFILFAMITAITLGGCNTFQGAGKDLERGGEKIQDAARDAKR